MIIGALFCFQNILNIKPALRRASTSGQKFYLRPLRIEGEGFSDGVKNYNLTQFAIPFGGGIKLSLSDNINVGVELGLRKLFTDYLDDISKLYLDQNSLLNARGAKAVELAYPGNELKNGTPYPPAGTIRGRSKHKDWYYFKALPCPLHWVLAGLEREAGDTGNMDVLPMLINSFLYCGDDYSTLTNCNKLL